MNQVEVKRRQIQMYSHMIGIIILFVLGKTVGDNGIAYIAVAVECYSFLLLILGGSTADTLGKILRGRNAKGQYKNVARMRRNVMILQCILGAIGTGLLFACAGLLAESVFRIPYSSFLIRLLAPAVFLRTVSSVFLGFFQGDGSELPSAVTGVIRQIFLLGFSVLFCNILKEYGVKVSGLLGREEFTSMYGAAGVAIAVNLTEVLIILFLLLIYKGSKRPGRKQPEEGLRTMESFWDFTKILYGNMGFSILISLFAKLPVWMGILFFSKSMQDTSAAVQSYGLYYGEYLAACAFFVLPICASMTSICSRIIYYLKREEQRYAKSCFQSGVHLAWVNALYFSIASAAMAQQLSELFCTQQAQAAANMLRIGSGLIVFVAFAFYFQKVLLYTGKKYEVLGSLGVMNVVFVITSAVFLNTGKAGIQALVYAGLISSAVLCVLLGFFSFRQLRSGLNLLQTLVIPAGAAGMTGLLCILVGKLITPHLGNLVTALIGFVLSFFVYWGILLFLRNFREQELSVIQGGRLIRLFGRFLHGGNV